MTSGPPSSLFSARGPMECAGQRSRPKCSRQGAPSIYGTGSSPATLISAPGETDALESAAQDVDGWTRQGNTLVTILDSDYPARLGGP
jgi:hypothetical protein